MIVFHYHNYPSVAMRLFVKWGVPRPAGTPCEKFAYIWSMEHLGLNGWDSNFMGGAFMAK